VWGRAPSPVQPGKARQMHVLQQLSDRIPLNFVIETWAQPKVILPALPQLRHLNKPDSDVGPWTYNRKDSGE
jgi:hypothetical protein